MSIRALDFEVRKKNVHLLLDYVVLLPEAYYEATILQVQSTHIHCLHKMCSQPQPLYALRVGNP
jgi:hypothetical protein